MISSISVVTECLASSFFFCFMLHVNLSVYNPQYFVGLETSKPNILISKAAKRLDYIIFNITLEFF